MFPHLANLHSEVLIFKTVNNVSSILIRGCCLTVTRCLYWTPLMLGTNITPRNSRLIIPYRLTLLDMPLTLYVHGQAGLCRTLIPYIYTANPLCKLCKKLCKVVYYMNHTTQLCGSYSTQLYTTLHNGFAVYYIPL